MSGVDCEDAWEEMEKQVVYKDASVFRNRNLNFQDDLKVIYF